MVKFLQAVSILAGMIIGVGMFGIPFSFAKSGFLLGFVELILITGLILLYHLLYSEVVLATASFHRLPGYVNIYLGKRWAGLEWMSSFFGILGSLLAYLILGSVFLHGIIFVFFPGISYFISVFFLIFLTAVVNKLPLKKEARLNSVLMGLLIAFVCILIFILLPHVEASNFSPVRWEYGFLPYGILLFALSGGVVIPDLVTFLGRSRPRVRRAIFAGTFLPAVLYGLFAFAVAGSSGSFVTEEAISGLLPVVGFRVVLLGNIIGFLATLTSLIALAESFEALLRLDLKLSPFLAQIVTTAAPAGLYFLGIQNFLLTISLVGALAIGIDSLMVVAVYHALQVKMRRDISFASYAWKIGVGALLLFGVGYELITLLL
ncbi:MAG: hypothetical protein HYT37_03415 [Candidatus Sungbacteria bacterium]|nr:hypothetical protein [Candidatus Sungbacteria bacterium]